MLKTTSIAIVLVAMAGVATAQEWGDLEGTFVYKGTPRPPTRLSIEKDPEICGKFNLTDEILTVNKENGGIANIAVYLFTTGGKKVAIHPDYEKTAKDEVVVDNQNCRFSPHMSGLRTSQILVLTNKDPVGHNTKCDLFNAKNLVFNDNLPVGTELKKNDKTKNFVAAETVPAVLSCSSHPWMKAYLVVREDPYFAVTDKDGKFTIKNLPVGEHTFKVWHETGYVSKVAIGGKETTWARGDVKFTIKPGPNTLGKVEATPTPR